MVITDQLIAYKTINNLLKQCKTIKQIHQLHAHFITTGLLSLNPCHNQSKILIAITTVKPTSSTTILLSYAVSVFYNIPNPSTFCFNTIIRAHTLLSSPLNAFLFFSQMRSVSVPPDFHSFPFVLKACSQLGSLSSAQAIHSQALKFGFVSDLFVSNSLIHVYSVSHRLRDAHYVFDESSHRDVVSYNALIDGYAKAGDVAKARELFDKMPFRDSVSWGTLVSGYAKSGQCKEAIKLFHEMMELNIRPDNIALVSALSACAQLGELECGKRIHDYIEHNRIRVDSFLSTGLVDFYAKCGYIEIAIEIFESSQGKNLCTWNAMLVGLAMHGHGQLLLDYFSRMIKAGVEPDGVTFLGVLVGCSHAGLVDEARKLFDKMESAYGVSRELKHYGCMADLLGRAGLIKEAMEMIKMMPMSGDVSVWSGLLGGCRIHGNVEIAEQAAEHVMELKPEDGGVYKIMADLYANAERWEDVVKIRTCMDAGKIKKIAGCSLIQLNGVMHEFVAGDDLHPRTDEIYVVLNAITKHQYEAC
ncbi:hypothetical protein EZV62_019731 [Acer yangbiense]|uniref:Pentacotripeptide-repeat region of PRORP domain-containing protein n=1 Tax=Acer yangbiense TaxID=1000413 RepID=A0A5C7HD02_9ROSI|nr:hypothetical protein EZV62_019731 [Acer yangbiense]